MTCKDCIHERVCCALIESGLPYVDNKYPAETFCMTFRDKSNYSYVVRCKDCKYNAKGYCGNLNSILGNCNENDYCSYGKN